MSDFVRTVPRNVRELSDNFAKLAKNKSHVKKVEVNLTSAHLEVTLDWAAHHMGGTPDFFLPLKRAKVNDAKELVNRMIREMDQGFTPSDSEVQQLYDMIDPAAQ